jgi:hypothetical protein
MISASSLPDKQKVVYSLTEKGVALLPVFVHIGAWGRKHLPVSEELSIRAELLEEGGAKMWKAFMNELRQTHLGKKSRRRSKSAGVPVSAILQAAYEEVAAGKKRGRKKRT